MILRPYKSCDAQHILRWCSDEDTFLKWSGGRFGPFPITSEDINGKYNGCNGDCTEPDNFYPMTAVDGEPVGHMILRYTGGDPSVIRFGWVIVDGEKRGRGYGRQMLRLALKYAFELLQARKVTIGVFEDNLPAYRCYRAVSFRDTGEIQEAELNGECWRILELEMTREEYFR